MYRVEINLENRREYVNYYSLWAANQKGKEYASCVDVIGVVIISNETGEVMTTWEYGKLTYVSEIGEIK